MAEEKRDILTFVNSGVDALREALKYATEKAGKDFAEVVNEFTELHDTFAPRFGKLLVDRQNTIQRAQEILETPGISEDPTALVQKFIDESIFTMPSASEIPTDPKIAPIDKRLAGPAVQLTVPAQSARYITSAMTGYNTPISPVVRGVSQKFISILSESPEEFVVDEKESEGFCSAYLCGLLKLPTDKFLNKALTIQLTGDKQALIVSAEGQQQKIDYFGCHVRERDKMTEYYVQDEEDPNKFTTLLADGSFGIKAISTLMLDFEDGNGKGSKKKKAQSYINTIDVFTGELTYDNPQTRQTRGIPAPKVTLTKQDGSTCEVDQIPLLTPRVSSFQEYIKNAQGGKINAFILDMYVLGLGVQSANKSGRPFSETGKLPVFVPKTALLEDVVAVVDFFSALEDTLGLKSKTLQVNLMIEEALMVLNQLAALLYLYNEHRLAGKNNGFLDLTGSLLELFRKFFKLSKLPINTIDGLKGSKNIAAYEHLGTELGFFLRFYKIIQDGKGMETEYQNGPKSYTATAERYQKEGINASWAATLLSAIATAVKLNLQSPEKLSAMYDSYRRPTPEKLLESYQNLLIPFLNPSTMLLPQDKIKDSTYINAELLKNTYLTLDSTRQSIEEGLGATGVTWQGKTEMSDAAVLRILQAHINIWIQSGLVSEKQVETALLKAGEISKSEGHKVSPIVREACDKLTVPRLVENRMKKHFGLVLDVIVDGVQQYHKLKEPMQPLMQASQVSESSDGPLPVATPTALLRPGFFRAQSVTSSTDPSLASIAEDTGASSPLSDSSDTSPALSPTETFFNALDDAKQHPSQSDATTADDSSEDSSTPGPTTFSP